MRLRRVWIAPDGTHWDVIRISVVDDRARLRPAHPGIGAGEWTVPDEAPAAGEVRELDLADLDILYTLVELDDLLADPLAVSTRVMTASTPTT